MSKKKTYIEDDSVAEFIAAQPLAVQAKYHALVDKLEEHGRLAEPDAKRLDDNLFEIRIRVGATVRVIYCYLEGNLIYGAHGFVKKSQQTPLHELRCARRRIRQMTGD